MKTVIIDKKNLWRYDLLLPEDLVPLLENPFGHFLGLIREEKDGAVPVGLLILSESRENGFTIEWLGIHPGERGKGYGSLLLDTAFQYAKDRGKEFLRAVVRYLPPEKENAEADQEGTVGRFLLDAGFLPEPGGSLEKTENGSPLRLASYIAMTDALRREEDEAAAALTRKQEAEKKAEEIPTDLIMTDVEYLSGVEL